MSNKSSRMLTALVLLLSGGTCAHASDNGRDFKGELYVGFRKPSRPRDLSQEFVQKTRQFSLEYAGKRVSPTMAGFIYRGERIEKNLLLLASLHGDVRGWVDVTAVVPVSEAEEFYSRELAARPADAFLYLMRGIVRLEKNDLEPALSDLNEAVRHDPRNVAGLVTRAVLWVVKNQPEQALADANKAVELDSRNAYAFEQRAMILGSLKKFDAALADFDRARELGSHWVMIHVARGVIFLKQGDLEKAQVEIDRAIEMDPQRVDVFVHLAVLRSMRSEYDKALEAVNRAIEIDPESGEAFAARAVIHHSMGDDDEALKDLDETIRVEHQVSLHYQNRARLQLDKGDYRSALADIEAAIRLDPGHAEALHSRAWILSTCPTAKIRNPEQAVVSATRACELTRYQEPRYLETLAIACSETGDFSAAVKWQEKAMALRGARDPVRRESSRLLKRYQANKPYHRLGLLEELGLKAPTTARQTAGQNPG